MIRTILSVPLLACAALAAPPSPCPQALDDYNVTWNSPSSDASGAMPIGNGEVGANVWTEPNGDLVFYLSRTDSWSEACRLMKLARVRVSTDPPLFKSFSPFRQTLDLRHGRIQILAGQDATGATLEFFFDPDNPIVHVTGAFATPRHVRITLETWRNERLRLAPGTPELASSWTMHDAPDAVQVWESADHILDAPGAIEWCHRNEDSIVPLTLQHQSLQTVADAVHDPLIHRTFGGRITASPASAFENDGPRTLHTASPVDRFSLRIATSTLQTETLDQWRTRVREIDADAPAADAAREHAAAWWSDFWSRSWVFIDGDAPRGVPHNDHPITFGQDSNGENRYTGEINSVGMYPTPFDDNKIARLARGRMGQPPAYPFERCVSFVAGDTPGATFPNSAAMTFPQGFTCDALVKPDANLTAARLIDKITAGQSDGFLFDIQPGTGAATLRLIVGDHTLVAPNVVKLGQWNRLNATYDAAADRLRLFVAGKEVATSARGDLPPDPRPPSLITRGYLLQRWMQACAGRGNYPIKFNGSIFTVDAKYTNGVDASPDYRAWGDGYWWQNSRLPYHPMLASGDFDQMDPLFRLFELARPLSEARSRLYHHTAGAYFPETMSIFGTYSNGDYGWNREGHDPSDVLCPWWQFAWNQGTELVALMLDRYDYTQDASFAREHLVPMARSVLSYFDTRFKRDEHGTLIISPTQAVETYWHNVVNDMPSVAGLHDITTRLLALPPEIGSPDDRALWQRIHDALPPLPTREADGVKMLAPAEKYDPKRTNCETPELYCVFPHRLVGLDSPPEMLEMARQAYRRRHDKATQGWTQDGQFAALLGLTDDTQANILAKARNSNPRHRFPAMWGPNFDWLPDQCHGSNLMEVVQCMLLQPVGERGDKLLLLPAWPKEWNVSFKLHAPKNTTIECEYRDGKVTRLEVTPPERASDVEVMTPGQ